MADQIEELQDELVDNTELDSEAEPSVEEEEEEENIDDATGLPQDIVDAILTVSKYYENEDRQSREMMIGFWRKGELYFEGIHRIAYDFGLNDWKRLDALDDYDPNLYDKIINIYRAHGESLISALSIKLPNVIFYPDDAEVIDDVNTAKAYSKIADLISRHNESTLIFMRALFILFNQGVACAYIYNRASQEYGTTRIPNYGPKIRNTHYNYICPSCGVSMGENESKVEETALPQEMQHPEEVQCPQCGAVVSPNIDVNEEILPQIVGFIDEPKSRTCIDVFGPLYAQIALYARKQEHTPYVRLRFEQHSSMLREQFPELRDKISPGKGRDSYDRWSRAYAPVGDEYQSNLVTVTEQWLRPWAFEMLDDEDLVKKLKAKFPNGCYATLIGDIVAQARDENLDEHWEITANPLSNYLHADPMGKPLMAIQELRTEAIDLAIETFEHSIPETFADSTVLNFDKYGQEEAKPGMVYPVKPVLGKPLSASFHSTKTATLNEEIESFLRRLDTDGQFTSGDFPSVHGGPNTSGSKTASEYSQSRGQALQRLNITWTMLKHWWAKVMSRAVILYVEDMLEDEKYSEQTTQSDTGFVNVYIRQSELSGKVGRVEPDANEELPTSFSQVKNILLELIMLNNENINEGLFHPQNTPLIAKALGLPQLYIPSQDSRDKQYAEISELLKSGPMPDGMPSVNIEFETDDHAVEAETSLAFLNSPTGVAQKKMNPLGYSNVVAHYLLHKQAMMMQQTQMADGQSNGGQPTPEEQPQEN